MHFVNDKAVDPVVIYNIVNSFCAYVAGRMVIEVTGTVEHDHFISVLI